MQNEIVNRMWSLTKGIVDIMVQQQKQVELLSKSHFGLVDALCSECGLDSTSPAKVIGTESVERAKAEVAELEKLFNFSNGGAA